MTVFDFQIALSIHPFLLSTRHSTSTCFQDSTLISCLHPEFISSSTAPIMDFIFLVITFTFFFSYISFGLSHPPSPSPPLLTSSLDVLVAVAAATKSLQLCPTLCDPTDGSPPGSSIHGIFQARVLEWGAIAFSGCPGYCKQCFSEHWSTCVSFNSGFLGVYAQKWDCCVVWQFYFQFLKESPHCSP